MRGYQKLARAVLRTAIIDARGCGPRAEQALYFLTTPGPLLQLWTTLSDLSMDRLVPPDRLSRLLNRHRAETRREA